MDTYGARSKNFAHREVQPPALRATRLRCVHSITPRHGFYSRVRYSKNIIWWVRQNLEKARRQYDISIGFKKAHTCLESQDITGSLSLEIPTFGLIVGIYRGRGVGPGASYTGIQ